MKVGNQKFPAYAVRERWSKDTWRVLDEIDGKGREFQRAKPGGIRSLQQDFDDLITPETSDFWKAQLLRNRDESINILLGLRQARGAQPPVAAPAPEPEPEPQRKPLFRNRLINPVRTMSEIATIL